VSEIRLIIESWRTFLHEGALNPCPIDRVSVGEFKTALNIAASDPDIQKEKIEKLKKQSGRLGNPTKIFALVSLVAGVPVVGAAAGLSFAAGLLGSLAFGMKAKQDGKTDEKINQLLGLLCIDDDLLDVMDNRIETEYWENSDLKARVDAYANSADDNEPMPNFTQHFLQWLNNDSDYAKDSDSTPNTKVVEK
jgi:hypothetical protein